VAQDINVLALVKAEERYIFLFDDNNRAETLRTLGRYASDPGLSFTWYDAAVLSQKIRKTVEAQEAEALESLIPAPHFGRLTRPKVNDNFTDNFTDELD
jgi:hypothetical protein